MNSLVRYEIRVTDIFVVCYKDIFERSKINKNMQNHSIVISKQKDNDEVYHLRRRRRRGFFFLHHNFLKCDTMLLCDRGHLDNDNLEKL